MSLTGSEVKRDVTAVRKEWVPADVEGRSSTHFESVELEALIRRVHQHGEPSTADDVTEPDIYFEEVRLHSSTDPLCGSYIMPIVTLRTTVCRWASRSGCVMCGYRHGAAAGAVTEGDLVKQTRNLVARLDPRTYPAIVYTSNGSFLDPREVPDETRPRLLGLLREAGFRMVVCETRPEFVTDARLDSLLKACTAQNHKTVHTLAVSVSVGIESSNEYILQCCLNKGETLAAYRRAFARLRRNAVPFDCYVLLGKPFLTAEEDIADALNTIEFSVAQGAGYVFLMILNLVKGTLVAGMAELGLYALPSLWRAVDLMHRLPPHLRQHVQVKAFEHSPVTPEAFATTCSHCEREVRSGINFWNQTGDFQHIQLLPRCACREKCLQEHMAQYAGESLPRRVDRIIGAVRAEMSKAHHGGARLQSTGYIGTNAWHASTFAR